MGLFAQTVTTDKLDYLPGETAFASGSGWVPNEAIILNVSEEPLIHEDVVTNTTTDSSGDFTNVAIYNFDASDYGSNFTLTATGETSGYTATAYFTDGAQDIWTWRNQSVLLLRNGMPVLLSNKRILFMPREKSFRSVGLLQQVILHHNYKREFLILSNLIGLMQEELPAQKSCFLTT